jgi:hypothetical protein
MNPTFTAKWRGVALMKKMRVNQEIIRAREIIAELRSNNEKAHHLTHRLRNFLTVHHLTAGSPNRGRFPMLLRNHPLMSYHGVSSWPPVWTWTGGLANKDPEGEIGIQPTDRCYLYIEHEGASYVGCLLFDDHPLPSNL